MLKIPFLIQDFPVKKTLVLDGFTDEQYHTFKRENSSTPKTFPENTRGPVAHLLMKSERWECWGGD